MMFSILQEYSFVFAQGALMTITAWLASSIISLLLGTLIGIARAQQTSVLGLTQFLHVWVFFTCALPVYVQILCAYFVIPDILCIKISPWTAGIWALGLCSSAYTSEIIKSGINSIPLEQWETAQSLGYSKIQTLWYIILPQVCAQTFSLLLNECNLVLKSTALFSSIGIIELTKTALNISMRTYNPLPVYSAIALIYVLLTSCITLLARQYKPQGVVS